MIRDNNSTPLREVGLRETIPAVHPVSPLLRVHASEDDAAA